MSIKHFALIALFIFNIQPAFSGVSLHCEEFQVGSLHNCDAFPTGGTNITHGSWSVLGNLRILQQHTNTFSTVAQCLDNSGGGLVIYNYSTASGQHGNLSYSAGCSDNSPPDDPNPCSIFNQLPGCPGNGNGGGDECNPEMMECTDPQ